MDDTLIQRIAALSWSYASWCSTHLPRSCPHLQCLQRHHIFISRSAISPCSTYLSLLVFNSSKLWYTAAYYQYYRLCMLGATLWVIAESIGGDAAGAEYAQLRDSEEHAQGLLRVNNATGEWFEHPKSLVVRQQHKIMIWKTVYRSTPCHVESDNPPTLACKGRRRVRWFAL